MGGVHKLSWQVFVFFDHLPWHFLPHKSWQQVKITIVFPHISKALPRIIPAFLIMPALGTLLCGWNLITYNNNRSWRPYKEIIYTGLIWGNTILTNGNLQSETWKIRNISMIPQYLYWVCEKFKFLSYLGWENSSFGIVRMNLPNYSAHILIVHRTKLLNVISVVEFQRWWIVIVKTQSISSGNK